MSNNIYIVKEHRADNCFSEIDFDLQNEFDFNYEVHEDFKTIEIGYGNSDGSFPVNINRMIGAIQDLQKLGATHVEISYHEDHIGYDISGFIMRKATEEEINDIETREKIKREKEDKRTELLRQLKELDREQKAVDNDDYPF
jgi:hypothetical protein